MSDIQKAIHESIRRTISRGFEPKAIILCGSAYTNLIREVEDFYRNPVHRITEYEGLPVFVIPDEDNAPGHDFWVKIAVVP